MAVEKPETSIINLGYANALAYKTYWICTSPRGAVGQGWEFRPDRTGKAESGVGVLKRRSESPPHHQLGSGSCKLYAYQRGAGCTWPRSLYGVLHFRVAR